MSFFSPVTQVFNAEVDLKIKAEIRALAIMGVLLATVGVEGRH